MVIMVRVTGIICVKENKKRYNDNEKYGYNQILSQNTHKTGSNFVLQTSLNLGYKTHQIVQL